MKGFSRANLFYMRRFAQAWPDVNAIVQRPIGRLPWGHVIELDHMCALLLRAQLSALESFPACGIPPGLCAEARNGDRDISSSFIYRLRPPLLTRALAVHQLPR